jgi:hypothetical protein
VRAKKAWLVVLVLAALAAMLGARWWTGRDPVDAPKAQGKTTADFPQTASRWFDAMDGGVALTDEERRGRNTWVLWTAGNQEFWDYMAGYSFGTVDLLKTLDTRRRNQRFAWYGLINDPDMKQADAPDRYGLWLDVAKGESPKDVDPAVYGYPSGIVGLRLFPNPDFDEAARARWNAQAYYTDRRYYDDPDLLRPYRVGMTCGFCHIAFHPLHPPRNSESPTWANLSNNIGNQYLRIGRVFAFDLDERNFVWQLFNTNPPGALDTSFIATDHINNPRAMNSIHNVVARLAVAQTEAQGPGAMSLPGWRPAMNVPHVLKDGADSIGMLGALARVYVSIGEFHQEWLRNFNPILGGKPQTPFEIEKALRNSVYWQATLERLDPLAKYFLKAAGPMYLKEAPNGKNYLTRDSRLLKRGKLAFADNCAPCHSSRQPAGERLGTEPYKQKMRAIVLDDDFLVDNYLSTDRRIAVTRVKTNACSALATNATRGHIWDNFSSETYKALPSVGEIEVIDPITYKPWKFEAPGGGPGYVRIPTLVAIWAGAPFFHNNSLGKFTGDASVEGRLEAYRDAMNKLLWPDQRLGVKSIYRTTKESWIRIRKDSIPDGLRPFLKDMTDASGDIQIGPIPKGTPVNLLSNIDIDVDLRDTEHLKKLAALFIKIRKKLHEIREQDLTGDSAVEQLTHLVPGLLARNKCPDFVTDRGHYFGTNLSDEDKRALIEFVKSF